MTGNGERGAVSGTVPALTGAPQGLRHPAPVPPATPEAVGYRGPSACAAAGVTYRQLDYWARTGLVEPTLRPAQGAGSHRLYGFHDVLVLKIVRRLLDAGISLQSIRHAVRVLRSAPWEQLAGVTLLCDGAEVHRCTSAEEVAELLRDGRGMFGIAVEAVWRDVEADLAQLPAERLSTGETVPAQHPADELALRRKRSAG